jgi:GTP-binding protein EngB required for normal cell division
MFSSPQKNGPANIYLLGAHNTGKSTIMKKLFQVIYLNKGVNFFDIELEYPLITEFGRASRKNYNF